MFTVDGDPPDGVYSTVYPVIALPPLLAGAVQDNESCVLPVVADSEVGAPGTVRGVALLDAAE